MVKVKFGKWEYDEDELRRRHKEATGRGKERERNEPQACAARYDRKTHRLVIELTNGTTFIVPCDLLQGLRDAPPKLIAEVEILPRGYGLHWEKLDQDFTTAGLLAGLFGTRTWMAELGRAGGRRTTPKKAAASRANGKLGGRPRKTTRSA